MCYSYRWGSRAVRHRLTYRRFGAGIIACTMAYVLALQVTLALSLNAWLPPELSYALGEICHAQTSTADGAEPGDQTPVKYPAHCPFCMAPSLAMLAPPVAPYVVLRQAIDIVFAVRADAPVTVAAIDASHRARAPPAMG